MPFPEDSGLVEWGEKGTKGKSVCWPPSLECRAQVGSSLCKSLREVRTTGMNVEGSTR